jgi:ParB/RepB/Spo0J family partition protein
LPSESVARSERFRPRIADSEEIVVDVPIVEIAPAPDNPRQSLGKLDGLVASIRSLGILQPLLLVRQADPPRYVIVCGERRWAAAIEVGLTSLPCIVRVLSESERVEAMLVENLQRCSLTRLEEAHAFHRLVHLGHTQSAIARRIGKSQSYVCRRLLLLTLAADVRLRVERCEVPVEQALGYQAAPAEDAFMLDEELQRTWLSLRGEILDSGDRRLIRRLKEFAQAHVRWRNVFTSVSADS